MSEKGNKLLLRKYNHDINTIVNILVKIDNERARYKRNTIEI